MGQMYEVIAPLSRTVCKTERRKVGKEYMRPKTKQVSEIDRAQTKSLSKEPVKVCTELFPTGYELADKIDNVQQEALYAVVGVLS